MNANKLLIGLVVFLGASFSQSAFACFQNDVRPSVVILRGAGGSCTFGIGGSVFAPTGPTTCICGIGIGSTTSGLPPGLSIISARVQVRNTITNALTTVSEFNPLTANAITTAGLAGGAGATPGSTMFGFAGVIAPFTPPTLGANEEFFLNFQTNINQAQLAAFAGQPVQFTSGVGFADGTPDFADPAHATQYFAPTNDALGVAHVPEPSSALILCIGLAVVARRRRR